MKSPNDHSLDLQEICLKFTSIVLQVILSYLLNIKEVC